MLGYRLRFSAHGAYLCWNPLSSFMRVTVGVNEMVHLEGLHAHDVFPNVCSESWLGSKVSFTLVSCHSRVNAVRHTKGNIAHSLPPRSSKRGLAIFPPLDGFLLVYFEKLLFCEECLCTD